jgi:hypothetical protein
MVLDGGGIDDGGGIAGGGIDGAETLAELSFCEAAGTSGVPSLPEVWVASSAGAGG